MGLSIFETDILKFIQNPLFIQKYLLSIDYAWELKQ